MSAPTLRRSELPDFIGSWPRLIGRQEPEFESRHGIECPCCPTADEIEGDRCAQFGANVGIRAMPWQWSMERGILSLRPPNEFGERLWTHRDSCIEDTRQQGKTFSVVRLINFHLFVDPVDGRPPTRKIIYTAQRWSTAADVFDRVCDVINGNPFLKAQLARKPSRRDNHGVIELLDGTKAEFAPRSQDFGRGLTEIDVLIIDESYDIVPAHIKNLRGAQSAAKNPQTIYISTPPVFEEHPNCHMLGDLHRQGHRNAPDLFYQLYAAPRHMQRDDPEAWRLAQPSYGIATDEREIRSTYEMDRLSAKRRALFDADYLGWGSYPPPEHEEDSEIPAEKWAEMGTKNRGDAPELTGNPAVVLERTPGGPWAIVAAWRTKSGLVHLEVGYADAAAPAVVAAMVVQLSTSWQPCATLVRSGSAAAELLPDLEKVGIEVTVLNSTEVAQACGGFLNAALAGQLQHSDQPGLTDAVSAAVKKDLPGKRGGFVWDLVDTATYAQLMGASEAHYGLVKYGKPKRKRGPKPAYDRSPAESPRRGTETARWGAHDDQFNPLTAVF